VKEAFLCLERGGRKAAKRMILQKKRCGAAYRDELIGSEAMAGVVRAAMMGSELAKGDDGGLCFYIPNPSSRSRWYSILIGISQEYYLALYDPHR